jgi:hypothetical protein
MLDRRRFLIGASGLLTAAFVRKATTYSRTAGEPLILPTPKRPEETLCVYWQECSSFDAQWRLSLGPYQPFAPPPPTWREHLISRGRRLDTAEDLDQIELEMGLRPEDLDTHLNSFSWEDSWDNFTSPQAKAHHLLKELDLGSAPDSKLKQAGQIIFESFGAGPGNCYTWVELKDDVTVSLLQARLIELNLPIDVQVCGRLADCA